MSDRRKKKGNAAPKHHKASKVIIGLKHEIVNGNAPLTIESWNGREARHLFFAG